MYHNSKPATGIYAPPFIEYIHDLYILHKSNLIIGGFYVRLG